MLLHSLLVSYGDYFKDDNGNKHYDYPDIWTSFAKDSLTTVFLWVALALAIVLIAIGLLVKWKKPESMKGYLTAAISLAVGFSGAVIIAMLALEFYDMAESGAVFDIVLYPSLVTAGAILLGAAAVYAASLFSKKAQKITLMVALSVASAALVALLVCLGVYLSSGSAEENNGAIITLTENIVLYVCAAVLVGLLLFFALFFGKKEKKGFDSKAISYAAVCIAMSFALSYLRLWKMPQGGSVTAASLLPLMIYTYMFGVKKGTIAGFIYGILQAVQDPWIIHPAQFLLDYPVAFAFLGVAGIFGKIKKLDRLPQVQFALGGVAASLLRFASHVLSGVFAFSEYSTLDNVWIYSMGYNSFVFVDIAVVIVAGVLVFSSPSIVKQVRKFRPKEEPQEQHNEEQIDAS
ncbi:MAG: energy-coupled thiamine transporter ThiT [Clostridiales bacterium]|nr:energy-coupled thiamine transporter ThiT [Clostridiales bacterium]